MTEQVLPEVHGYAQILPWRSKRLTNTHLCNIAKAMDLQISREVTSSMIEGRFTEMGKDPVYIQVGLVEGRIDFLNAEGVFFSVTIEKDKESGLVEERGYHEEPSVTQQEELELAEVTARNIQLSAKVCNLEAELETQKNRNQALWKMNCSQLKVYDSELSSRDAEIAKLMSRPASGGKSTNAAGSGLGMHNYSGEIIITWTVDFLFV